MTTASDAQATVDSVATSVRQLLERATAGRVIVGFTGPPGTGKSTIAEMLAESLSDLAVGLAPMDGFHLAQSVIDGTELASRKGAIDTFDAYGYVNLIRRLRQRDEPVVYAPEYRRDVEESIGSALAIDQDTSVVITEGNYLLAPVAPWSELPDLLDAVWFVDTPHELRRQRLIARHIQSGKAPADAEHWTDGPDEANAQQIASWSHRATGVVHWV